MDDSAFEALDNALSHNNEWRGHNIQLSVNESPELEELLDVDLAQCIGKAEKKYVAHSKPWKLNNQVSDCMSRLADNVTIGHPDITPFLTLLHF
jgi:hypothetical protein